MQYAYIAIAIAAVLSMVTMSTAVVTGQTQTNQVVEGSFANVETVQDEQHIVITITKTGGEVPDGPVVIIPEEPGGDGNGTIIIPEENQTDTGAGNETDVIVIEPDGNVTQVEGNVTNIDNSTVVIAPENQTVTETDAGVVVIDPPCECPVADDNTTAPTDGNATVIEPEPLPPLVEEPVTNDTILVPPTPNDTAILPVPEEPSEGTGGNVTAGEEEGSNGNGNGNGNESDNGNGGSEAFLAGIIPQFHHQ